MKKGMVSLITAACLAVAPVSVFAEETDYSYLEDMSVKELKELRDAINEILGDGGETDNEKTEQKQSIDLTEMSSVNVAALTMTMMHEALSDPYSIEWNEIQAAGTGEGMTVIVTFHAPTKVGMPVMVQAKGTVTKNTESDRLSYYISHPCLENGTVVQIRVEQEYYFDDLENAESVDVDLAVETMNQILKDKEYDYYT